MKILQNTKLQIVLLVLLCAVGFFLRSYATYRDLVFTYDQGRDAIMMQKLASGSITFIGPVTGLDGVYLGPFWFYLIFPFYFLSGGDPVAAAIEMKLFSVGVIILLYLWGKKAKMPYMGLFAGALYAVSFSNIIFARWLSNPVPLPFFALLGFYTLWNAIETKKSWLFALTGIIFGCCLQLEAANAIWFIPTTALIFFLETITKTWRKELRSILIRMTYLVAGFSLTILPQFLFELKNHFLITKNLIKAFQTTHDVSVAQSIPTRFPLLVDLYGRGLFFSQSWFFIFIVIVFTTVLIVLRKEMWSSRAWRFSFLWFSVPFFFHLLYTGNHGNFWDYYVIAQHVSLELLIAMTLGIIIRNARWKELGYLLIVCIFAVSLYGNLSKWTEIIKPYEARFSLQEQVDANTWMIAQANGQSYGAWVYTPSSQDDPYRYIFSWQGKKTGIYPGDHVEQQSLIFLVVEDDPVFWKREKDWINERMKFGTLLDRHRFGAITVFKLQNTFITRKIVQ